MLWVLGSPCGLSLHSLRATDIRKGMQGQKNGVNGNYLCTWKFSYEHQKHTGELPLIGVNTFLSKNGSPTILPLEVIRSTTEEKEQQIKNLQAFWNRNITQSETALRRLQDTAVKNENLFEQLMETVKYCSLGQITKALYAVGGQYRRNM